MVRIPITVFGLVLLFFFFIYAVSSSPVIRTSVSFLSGALVLFGGVHLYSFYNSPSRRLTGKLKTMNFMLITESSERIHSLYEEIVKLYLQLSDKQQMQFSEKMNNIQGILENQLRAKKKTEELLQQCGGLPFSARKKKYDELFRYYQQLPSKVQEEYYSEIVHVREGLERGK